MEALWDGASGAAEEAWLTELEALECIIEAANVRRPADAGPTVQVQVLFGSEGGADEYWVEVRRPERYPAAPLALGPLQVATKDGTVVPTAGLRAAVAAVAEDAAAVGGEALFSLVTAAKDFVVRCIEQDTQAALRAVEAMDAAEGGPIMKRIAHDRDLVQVYRDLDLTQTTVLLTACSSATLCAAVRRNVEASIKLYGMIHGDGIWSHLKLDAIWEVGFDPKDKSYAARRLLERRKCVGQAKHRRLLWHGSAVSAIACILTNGTLRKVQRASHGRMFGDGVYFADCMCKAMSYCSGGREDEFFLLLCSVALDKLHETDGYLDDVSSEVRASGVPLAVHGNLHMTQSTKLETGDVLSVGGCSWRGTPCAVNFNEFIVYQEDGHVNRFLVRLKVKNEGLAKRRIHGR